MPGMRRDLRMDVSCDSQKHFFLLSKLTPCTHSAPGVAVVTLNRPKNLNAMNTLMYVVCIYISQRCDLRLAKRSQFLVMCRSDELSECLGLLSSQHGTRNGRYCLWFRKIPNHSPQKSPFITSQSCREFLCARWC